MFVLEVFLSYASQKLTYNGGQTFLNQVFSFICNFLSKSVKAQFIKIDKQLYKKFHESTLSHINKRQKPTIFVQNSEVLRSQQRRHDVRATTQCVTLFLHVGVWVLRMDRSIERPPFTFKLFGQRKNKEFRLLIYEFVFIGGILERGKQVGLLYIRVYQTMSVPIYKMYQVCILTYLLKLLLLLVFTNLGHPTAGKRPVT